MIVFEILIALLFLIGVLSFIFGFAIAIGADQLTHEGNSFVMKFIMGGGTLCVIAMWMQSNLIS